MKKHFIQSLETIATDSITSTSVCTVSFPCMLVSFCWYYLDLDPKLKKLFQPFHSLLVHVLLLLHFTFRWKDYRVAWNVASNPFDWPTATITSHVLQILCTFSSVWETLKPLLWLYHFIFAQLCNLYGCINSMVISGATISSGTVSTTSGLVTTIETYVSCHLSVRLHKRVPKIKAFWKLTTDCFVFMSIFIFLYKIGTESCSVSIKILCRKWSGEPFAAHFCYMVVHIYTF